MSVLHRRIMAHDGGQSPGAAVHPYGTPSTPMTMPLAFVHYGTDEQAVYGTVHPLVAADGAVIAGASHRHAAAPHPGMVVPAGKP